MSYAEHFSRHVRIAILRLLDGAPACRANSSIVHSALDQLGLTCTRDQVKTEIGWLAEQNLVRKEEVGDLLVATLTERGADAAAGRTVVHGVQRPTPR